MNGRIGVITSTYYQTLNLRGGLTTHRGIGQKQISNLSGPWFGKQIRQGGINRPFQYIIKESV